jgi:ATP-dependent protease ClpP protease subunit
MKTKLQIRGVIVDASFDCDEGSWLDDFIQRGVITPESRVRMALDKAEAAGDEVEIEICSPGGNVFAGIELANRIAHYPGNLTVRVGAFAASAAALIVLEAARAGKPVAAYRNSILLYHGAWAVTEGGRGAHADTAKLLSQINEPMKTALKAFGIPDHKVDRGFEEGRQLTMTAEEAASFGIVSEVVGEDALRFTASAKDAEDLLAHGIGGLAALVAEDFDPAARPADDPAQEPAAQEPAAQEPAAQEPAAQKPATPAADTGTLQARIEALEAECRSLQSAKDKEVSAVRNALEGEIRALRASAEAKDKEHADYKAETEKQLSTLHEELSGWKAKFEAEAAARSALVGAVNAPDADDQPADWPSAVRRFGGAEALRRFPGFAADYRKAHGAKKGRVAN